MFRTKLNRALGIKTPGAQEVKSRFTASGGLSRWDPYITLVEGGDEAFEARESDIGSSSNKVTFSHRFNQESGFDNYDRDFIRTLGDGREYVVSLWAGPNKPLPKPISSSIEFRNKLPEVVPATKEVVRQGLVKQNHSTDNVIFIDSDFYQKLKQELQKDDSYDKLDLRFLDIKNKKTRETIENSWDVKEIKKIDLMNPTIDEWGECVNLFTHPELVINLTWIESDWFLFYYNWLEENPLKRKFRIFTTGMICHQSILSIKTDSLSELSLDLEEQGARVKEVVLKRKSETSSLTSLSIQGCIKKLDLSKEKELKNISISFEQPEEKGKSNRNFIQLSPEARLDSFSLCYANLSSLKWEALETIKELKLNFCYFSDEKQTELNFSHFAALKNLAFKSPQDIVALPPFLENLDGEKIHPALVENQTSLKSLRLKFSEPCTLNLSKLNKLTCVSLTLVNGIQLKLPSCSEEINLWLQSEESPNETKNDTIDLSSCMKVRKLEFIKGKWNGKFIPPSSLSFLTELETDVEFELHRCEFLKKIIYRNISLLDISKLGRHVEEVKLSYSNLPSVFNFSPMSIIELTILGGQFQGNQARFFDSKHLTRLYLSQCSAAQVSISNMTSLNAIEIDEVEDLSSFSTDLLGNLEILSISSCSNLRNIAWENFPNLKSLKIKNCHWLNLPDFSRFPKLEEIEIIGNFDRLDISKCIHLKTVIIESRTVRRIQFPPKNQNSIESLEIDCKSLEEFNSEDHPGLVELEINAKKIKIANSDALTTVDLTGEVEDKQLPVEIISCPNLKKVSIRDDNFNELPEVKDHPLKVLILREKTPKILEELANSHGKKRNFSILEDYPDLNGPLPEELRNPKPPLEKKSTRRLAEEKAEETTAVFSFHDKKLGVDDETGISEKKYSASGESTLTLVAKESIGINSHRIQVLDKVVFENGKIEAVSSFDEKDLVPVPGNIKPFSQKMMNRIKNEVKSSTTEAAGILKTQIDPGEYVPLPAHHPLRHSPKWQNQEFEIYSNPEKGVTLYWDPKKQQFYLKSHSTYPITVLYRYKIDPEYTKQSSSMAFCKKTNLLPENLVNELRKRLDDFLKKFDKKESCPLWFLYDENLSEEKKVNLLKEYCYFKNEELDEETDESPAYDFEIFMKSIFERKGSCTNRSLAFKVLCELFLEIPAPIVMNEQHAFCEISYQANNKVMFRKFDFGGAPQKDETPDYLRENLFKQDEKPLQQKNKKNPPSKPSQSLIKKDSKKEENPYTRLFEDRTQSFEAKSVVELFQSKCKEEKENKVDRSLPPLLMLASSQHPFSVNKEIVRQLKASGVNVEKDYLYIHNSQELKTFLNTFKIENGTRKAVSGPLANLIKNGGYITINWNNFTDNEISTYKSIVDTLPTLFEGSVSTQLRVIGLASATRPVSSALLSRCQPFDLKPEFFSTLPEVTDDKQHVHHVEINLFGAFNWRKSLLGDIVFLNNNIYLLEGELIKAIKRAEKEKIQLTIYNPPDNEAFNLLIHRLRDEKRILYNGEFIRVPDNFKVVTESKPAKLELRNVISVSRDHKLENKKEIILGNHNFHQLFELTSSDNGNPTKDTGGLLHSYDPEKEIIYFSQPISLQDRYFLIDHIERKFPDKQFFIQGLTEDETKTPIVNQLNPADLLKTNQRIIVSNDPDLVCKQLLTQESLNEENVLVVHLTPQMRFKDLIYDQTIEKKEDGVGYFYREKYVLKALREGKKVILCGEMSNQLYHELLPLFSGNPPRMVLNGKGPIELKGELTAVLPNTAKTNYPKLQSAVCNYHFDHYCELFPDDKIYVKRIERYASCIAKLAHSGIGFPTMPHFSYERINNMISALKKPLHHRHNPVKGFLLYDYPKGSESYAYLNVMGKMTFYPEDKERCRKDKIKKLMKKFSVQHVNQLGQCIWQFLNCFNGNELIDMFGNDFEKMVSADGSVPTLSAEFLSSFLIKINKIVNDAEFDQKEEKKSHVEKRDRQFIELLHHHRMIMLKGPAGAGKTFSARKIMEKLNAVLYEGEQDIIRWLTENQGEKLKILLIDEANMFEPGTWDFLKIIQQNSGKSIFYKGIKYTVPDNLKIIFTGNPESFPERYYHPFFQQQCETLEFRIPEEDYLIKFGLHKNLGDLSQPEINQIFLAAYYLAIKMNIFETYSIRDLENVAMRFKTMVNKNKSTPSKELAYRACVGEFSGAFSEPKIRDNYNRLLADECKIIFQSEQKMDNDVFEMKIKEEALLYPAEQKYIVDILQQDLDMRQFNLEEKSNGYYRRAVLIDGEPGIGKSTLLEAFLCQQGFSETSDNSQKKYYKITSSNQGEAHAILLKAFKEGAVVLLKGLDLDERIEILLNKLLVDNKDMDGNPPDKSGFMVFASRTTNRHEGSKALSPALRNRFHFIYMNEYSPFALLDVARETGIDNPPLLVKAFEECKQKRPAITNMHTFRYVMKEAKKEFGVKSKKPDGDDKKYDFKDSKVPTLFENQKRTQYEKAAQNAKLLHEFAGDISSEDDKDDLPEGVYWCDDYAGFGHEDPESIQKFSCTLSTVMSSQKIMKYHIQSDHRGFSLYDINETTGEWNPKRKLQTYLNTYKDSRGKVFPTLQELSKELNMTTRYTPSVHVEVNLEEKDSGDYGLSDLFYRR